MNSGEKPPLQSTINIAPLESLTSVSELSINVSQKVIITTEDKLRLSLAEHLKNIEKKKGWIMPMCMFIAMAGTLINSNFKDRLLSASSWATVYIIAAVVFFIWLVYSIIQARRSESIEDIISALKRGAIVEKRELGSKSDKSVPF